MDAKIQSILALFKGCEHLRVRESMSCDAHCMDCGENLGFIQEWRDHNKGNPKATQITNGGTEIAMGQAKPAGEVQP